MRQALSRRWTAVQWIGALLILATGVSPGGSRNLAQTKSTAPSGTSIIYLPAVAQSYRVRGAGVFIPMVDASTWSGQVDSFLATTDTDHSMYVVSSGFACNWADSVPLIVRFMNKAHSLGATPLVTWMPTDCRNGGFGDVHDLGLPDILSGKWDAYIKQWASDIGKLPYSVFVRWGHEMNIPSYSWAGQYAFGVDGKSFYLDAQGGGCGLTACFGDPNVYDGPERYIAAYRHVHDLAAPLAHNILWVWNPNNRDWPLAVAAPWNQYNNYYPGDAYVDWIALDGYNWGAESGNGNGFWASFNDLFGADLIDLAQRHPTKPQLITEFASVEDPLDANRKPAWILDAYHSARNYPLLRVLVWVQDNNFIDALHHPNPTPVDFRVNSSAASLQAYKDATAAWLSDMP